MKKYLSFFILMLSHFSLNAEGISLLQYEILNCSNLYSFCEECNKDKLLFPLNDYSKNKDSLEVEADNSEITENNEYFITGNALIRSDENFLSADQILVSKEKKSTIASGSAVYQDNNFLILGSNISVKKTDNDEFIVDVLNADYQELASMANGSAQSINKTDKFAILVDSSYSLCPVNKNTWEIKADQIKLNLKTNRAIADRAKLVFYDVPIFYMPKYSWVSRGRGSGFLSPGLNFYKEPGKKPLEIQTRLPYYFNIAPDKDLLAALSFLSSRGLIFEGEYRQLIGNRNKDDGLFKIKSHYLFNDKITNNSRWLLDSSIELEINNNIHLSARYNKVSDSNYFKEIARSGTGLDRLDSKVKVEYNNPPLPEIKNSGKLDSKKTTSVNYGRNLLDSTSDSNQNTFSLYSEKEQVVNDGAPEYTKSIETSLFSRRINNSYSSLTTDLGLISTVFDHQTEGKTTGTRTHGEINFANNLGSIKPFRSAILSTNTRLGLTNYSLDNMSNENRAFGSFDIDLSFPSSKETTLFGRSVNRHIKPTISYDYTSKHKQSNIPLFDTSDTIDSLVTYGSLLSGERYSGIDRIVNENDITLSLHTYYKDSNIPKNSRLDFKIAQRYYGDDEAVSDIANTNFENRRRYSDISALLKLSLDDYERLTSRIAVQYDPKAFRIKKNDLSIIYKHHPRAFVSVKHSDDNSSRTLTLNGAYPINNRIHLFGGIDKSLSSGIINKQTSGVAYEDCCWSARLAHFKEILDSSTASYDYSTGFEIVFKGLGSTDTNLRDHIQSNLPEYKAFLSDTYNLDNDVE
jgi:LPS-assembly protein